MKLMVCPGSTMWNSYRLLEACRVELCAEEGLEMMGFLARLFIAAVLLLHPPTGPGFAPPTRTPHHTFFCRDLRFGFEA